MIVSISCSFSGIVCTYKCIIVAIQYWSSFNDPELIESNKHNVVIPIDTIRIPIQIGYDKYKPNSRDLK